MEPERTRPTEKRYYPLDPEVRPLLNLPPWGMECEGRPGRVPGFPPSTTSS